MPRRARTATSTRRRWRASASLPSRRRKARNERRRQTRDRSGVRRMPRARRMRRREPPGPPRVDGGAGTGRQGEARAAAAGEALRAVHVQRVRPARSVQAAQDRARPRQQQARARHGAAQGAAGSVPAGIAGHGGLARARQEHVRPGAHAGEGRLPGARRQLLGAGLRRHHRHQRLRNPAEGTRAGQRGRLDRADQHAAADPGRRVANTGSEKMSAFVWLGSAASHARAVGIGAWLFAAFALAAAGAASAQATNSIDSLSVTKGSSGRTIVRFTLKVPPANPPAGFAIANPARVALDFMDTGNGLGRTTQEVADSTLRSINVVQAGNRTRVVLNLNKPQTYETQVEGNTVTVTLFDQSDQLEAKSQTVQRFAEAKPGEAQQHALRDVDFRRGANGEGRIIVELSDASTGIDIRRQGRLLLVDFIDTAVPRNLERRLDVQDFATPVVSIDTLSQGANARMIIEPRGLWEHSAYQADNRLIVELAAVQEDPNKLV